MRSLNERNAQKGATGCAKRRMATDVWKYSLFVSCMMSCCIAADDPGGLASFLPETSDRQDSDHGQPVCGQGRDDCHLQSLCFYQGLAHWL